MYWYIGTYFSHYRNIFFTLNDASDTEGLTTENSTIKLEVRRSFFFYRSVVFFSLSLKDARVLNIFFCKEMKLPDFLKKNKLDNNNKK